MAGLFSIWIFLLFILGLVDSYEASPHPRVSFPRGSEARGLSVFHSSAVRNSCTLLLSSDANTLFVGARDAVLSLDVSQSDNMTLNDKLEWTPSEDNLNKCKMASKTDCGNFIRILQFFNSTHLYICGTNAYGPQGLVVPAGSLTARGDMKEAKHCCPYSSSQRNTAVIVDDELYTATKIGYFGESVISRCLSKGTRNNLVLDSEPKLLNGPVFISSAHIASEGKVLLFFTEAGDLMGDSFVNSFTVSRVAQVCTDDNGGNRVLQKRWTSFAKSQLVCQQGKELQFNVLQDIITLSDSDSPDNTLFYGVFTPQWSVSSGLSAVCAFSLTDIKAAFSGDYKTFNRNGNYWSRQPNADGKLGTCGLYNDSDSVLNTVKKTFLTKRPVRPVGEKLLLSSTGNVYSRVAAQRTVAADGQSYTVLFLLTESGFLHKVVLLSEGPHIIEEIQIFEQPQTVKNLLLSTSKAVLFVGSSEGVFRVSVSSCSVYPNCAECVLARDPFCGWDSDTRSCTAVSSMSSNLRQDVENGNVREQCAEVKNTASVPASVTRTAQLNEFVVLPCKSRSRLAEVTWRFLNDSVVSQFPYLRRSDGSLTFPVTPDTASTYRCVSEELGFRRTLAVFSVSLPVSPRSFSYPSHHHPDVARDSSKDPETEPFPVPDTTSDEPEATKAKIINAFITPADSSAKTQARTKSTSSAEEAVCTSQKSYFSEMLVFCLLCVMCVCVFAAFVILWRHNMRCNRTAPRNSPKDPETDNIWQTELEENPKS